MPTINRSFPEVFARRAAETPDLPWMIWKGKGGAVERLSFAEGRKVVESAARGLMALGISTQDRVGILSKNRPEWVLADFGAIHATAIPVPLYDTLAPPQLKQIINHSEMRLLFAATPEQLAPVLAMKSELPKLDRAVLFEGAAPAGSPIPVVTWEEFLKLGAQHQAKDPEAFEKRWNEIRRDDLITIVYTSGTTGDPKGVMLTHGNILSQIETFPRILKITVDDLVISYLPLAHIFERTVGEFYPASNGHCVAFAESIEKLPDNIREYRPTYLLAVPRVLEKVYDRVLAGVEEKGGGARRIFWWAVGVGRRWQVVRHEKRVPFGIKLKRRIAQRLVYAKVNAGLGGRLRFVVSGSAPLNPKIVEFFVALDLPVLEGYGLTESSPAISFNPMDEVVPGSVGKMIPGIQVEIWEKMLQGAPPGVEGEIVTKGPHVMKGYYKDDAATKATVDREGWLHTGDIGKRDPKGFIFITDRKKNIIVNSYGKNIAPGPIEARIEGSKYVSSAMLFGDKHKYVTALIVPAFLELEQWARAKGVSAASRAELITRPEVEQLYRELLDEVGKSFSHPEQVRRFALTDHELTIAEGTLTPSLKTKRSLVEKRYAPLIEALYSDEHTFAASWEELASKPPAAALKPA